MTDAPPPLPQRSSPGPSSRPTPVLRIVIIVVVVGVAGLFLLSVAAGFLVPTLLKGRGEAYKVQCANNLKMIYSSASSYSRIKGGNAFPIGPGLAPRAHESLNALISREDGAGHHPRIFCCPEGEAVPATPGGDDGKPFKLEAENLSYAWTARKLKNTVAGKTLASDKYIDGFQDEAGPHQGHKRGMVVLMSDGSISFVESADIPQESGLPEGLTR